MNVEGYIPIAMICAFFWSLGCLYFGMWLQHRNERRERQSKAEDRG